MNQETKPNIAVVTGATGGVGATYAMGLDRREQWVLPSLADAGIWDAFQVSRTNLVKAMMSGAVAQRYVTA